MFLRCHRTVTFLPPGCDSGLRKLGLMFACSCVLSVVSLLSASGPEGRSPVAQTKETLAKWVETRQLIAKSRTDWEADREVLSQTAKLLEKELARVEEQFSKTGGGSAQVEKESRELAKEKEVLLRAQQKAAGLLPQLEASISKLSKSLPSPLLSRVDELIKRLPTDPQATQAPLLHRMQTIVGLLNEIEKFNNTISVHSEIQKNAKGEEVQVKAMYLGLGQAYWVDKAGRAGVGLPGEQGWVWRESADLAERIRQAIAVQESSQPATFVSLPVTVK